MHVLKTASILQTNKLNYKRTRFFSRESLFASKWAQMDWFSPCALQLIRCVFATQNCDTDWGEKSWETLHPCMVLISATNLGYQRDLSALLINLNRVFLLSVDDKNMFNDSRAIWKKMFCTRRQTLTVNLIILHNDWFLYRSLKMLSRVRLIAS